MNAIHENRLLSRWAELLPRRPDQIGGVHETDAELVPLGDGRLLALKVDAVVEEIATGLYREPETAGRIAVCSVLSDLAAVGADPIGILLSVDLPPDAGPAQEGVAAGVRDAIAEAGVFVLGGDTSDAAVLQVTCVAAGTVPAGAQLTRVGLAPGDTLFAAGPVGLGAALAAARLLGAPGFTEADYRPTIRIAHGRALRGIASAAMDSSDGLLATLDQLARLNDCAVRIERPLPELLHPRAEAVRAAMGLPAFPFVASHHGEFELVFGVPPDRIGRLELVAASMGWSPIRLGRAEAGAGLWLGDVPVDGARFRNLLEDVGGDAAKYAAELLKAGLG